MKQMIEGMLLIAASGSLIGEMANRLGFPRLIGMFAAGVILGPHVLDALPAAALEVSEEARMFALIVILLKAGLGLDKEKILSQGTVALRLGFMPAVIEASWPSWYPSPGYTPGTASAGNSRKKPNWRGG